MFVSQLERGDFLSEEWKERIANTRWCTKPVDRDHLKDTASIY